MRVTWLMLACLPATVPAEVVSVDPDTNPLISFAFTSPAWGENVNTGMRLVAHNNSERTLVLESLRFLNAGTSTRARPGEDEVELSLQLVLGPDAWSETVIPYQDLLYGNQCIEETLADPTGSAWKLVEISNYNLNPSVRSLIIENSESFRIFSCPRDVLATWRDVDSAAPQVQAQWVLYHFESRQPQP
jgi:hypothetical protein